MDLFRDDYRLIYEGRADIDLIKTVFFRATDDMKGGKESGDISCGFPREPFIKVTRKLSRDN
jgi:hypothetical protein